MLGISDVGIGDVGIIDIPLLVRRGGRDIKKNAAKPLYLERTGWSITSQVYVVSDHPVCAVLVASQHFLTGAATPPHEEGIKVA